MGNVGTSEDLVGDTDNALKASGEEADGTGAAGDDWNDDAGRSDFGELVNACVAWYIGAGDADDTDAEWAAGGELVDACNIHDDAGGCDVDVLANASCAIRDLNFGTSEVADDDIGERDFDVLGNWNGVDLADNSDDGGAGGRKTGVFTEEGVSGMPSQSFWLKLSGSCSWSSNCP